MTEQELIDALNRIPSDDYEQAHGTADDLLLDYVPAAVRKAYEDLQSRCKGWYFA